MFVLNRHIDLRLQWDKLYPQIIAYLSRIFQMQGRDQEIFKVSYTLSNQMHEMIAPWSTYCVPHTSLGVLHALSYIPTNKSFRVWS